MGNSQSSRELLEKISEASGPRDLTFPVENITLALERDGEPFEKGYKEYVDMGNDVTISHRMKIDMDTAEFKAFLVKVKEDIPVGEFDIQELERCANKRWEFSKNSEEAMKRSEDQRNFLYYNIQRSESAAADTNGTQFRFSLAVYYLKSGRVIENNFVFYGGLIKENLLCKERDNFYLKYLT